MAMHPSFPDYTPIPVSAPPRRTAKLVTIVAVMTIWLGSTIAATTSAFQGDGDKYRGILPQSTSDRSEDQSDRSTPTRPSSPGLRSLSNDSLIVGIDETVADACFDWLDSCAGSYFASMIAQYQTIPAAYLPKFDASSNETYRPGPVLAGPARLEVAPVQTIIYEIAAAAKWSDGTKITCRDFQYTADQYMHGENLLDVVGYTEIDTVTCNGDSSVVVRYRAGETFAAWQTLFTIILPAHILEGRDRNSAMSDGYRWSGGPFIVERFDDRIELNRNPSWWGTESSFRLVTALYMDPQDLPAALNSGEVSAIVSPQNSDSFQDLAAMRGVVTQPAKASAFVESLWLNNSIEPFNSPAVRRAAAFAVDRNELVRVAWHGTGNVGVAQSLTPAAAAPYFDPAAWSGYAQSLENVGRELRADGWRKGADGYWIRNGRRLSFVVDTTDDERRASIEDAMAKQFEAAGIEMKIGARSADIFDHLGDGNYQAMLYAYGGSSEPFMCSIFCSENLPSELHPEGQNQQRVNDPALDKLLRAVDRELEPEARRSFAVAADRYMAQQQISLPLMTMPEVGSWDARLTGPHMNSVLGLFWNLNEWRLNAPAA